ncbi:hypothetical protein AMTR_s00041p00027800 [Amborella trichopoda]|uniref:Uncharacterized protein n=1 Tax=Amborella trichopoda TaxID=13333 RepID=W1Q063_AMBTC|nr:hypothetical protein AMTR_s00041p00027800 [Amborella trichopoda]
MEVVFTGGRLDSMLTAGGRQDLDGCVSGDRLVWTEASAELDPFWTGASVERDLLDERVGGEIPFGQTRQWRGTGEESLL